MRAKKASVFGRVLLDLVEKRGVSQRRLATQLGMTAAGLSAVVNGRRRFPPKKIGAAVAVLGLKGAEQHRFERWAHLSAMPASVQLWIAKLERDQRSDG